MVVGGDAGGGLRASVGDYLVRKEPGDMHTREGGNVSLSNSSEQSFNTLKENQSNRLDPSCQVSCWGRVHEQEEVRSLT